MTTSVETQPERIHLIFKTHLDIGFTDFASRVVQNYFDFYIPRAIELARTLRETGARERFVWTTGSWLIYEYLEQADAAKRKEMEEAIGSGDIAWHALPFTTHTELMDPDLFRFGLSLSQNLDSRFGKQTISAKMTDVPGHTRGIVPLLSEAGVRFLHIGVNAASTPPDVPPVFTWRDPTSGAEIIVMYHKGTYGDLMIVPGIADAIAFAHTGDNHGPQSIEELKDTFQKLSKDFPASEIQASTMDNFARRLIPIQTDLPVIQQEIGDTWIHGAGTDPVKVSRFRELLRWRLEHSETIEAARLQGFHRKILLVPEHTWGMDVKTHLNDWENYRTSDYQAVRGQPNYQKMEASWQEQRAYLRQAVEALPAELRLEAQARISALEPLPFQTEGYSEITDRSQDIKIQDFDIAFDPTSGAIVRLTREGINWASPANPIGSFWYESFSAAEYRRFYRQYNVNKRTTHSWALPDFTKPGIEPFAQDHLTVRSRVTWAGIKRTETGDRILMKLALPAPGDSTTCAPGSAMLELRFSAGDPEVLFDLRWFDKPACRLPEALWFSFAPLVRDPRRWRMNKLGLWISPFEVIRDGNRHLHAVGDGGIRAEGPTHTLTIRSLDAPLVAPGSPSLLDFNNRQPDLRHGFHFNLYNNLWGTNFPMWFEEDARFRFSLRIE